jgi:hypothetical protein
VAVDARAGPNVDVARPDVHHCGANRNARRGRTGSALAEGQSADHVYESERSGEVRRVKRVEKGQVLWEAVDVAPKETPFVALLLLDAWQGSWARIGRCAPWKLSLRFRREDSGGKRTRRFWRIRWGRC